MHWGLNLHSFVLVYVTTYLLDTGTWHKVNKHFSGNYMKGFSSFIQWKSFRRKRLHLALLSTQITHFMVRLNKQEELLRTLRNKP